MITIVLQLYIFSLSVSNSKSKSIKGISDKLVILAHHDKVQLQDKGHNSESYIFGVMPLFN